MSHTPLVRALAAFGAALALGAGTPDARAQEPGSRTWELAMSLGAEVGGGDTTYRIAASDGVDSVASELQFPLSSVMLRLHGELATRAAPGDGRFVLQTSVLTAPRPRAGSGTMRDSDWLSDSLDIDEVGFANPGKDIYSESDAELDALVVEARAAWEFPLARAPGLVLAPIVGMLYQRFDYDVRNVHQVGYGPYAPTFTGSAAGQVLLYGVTYRVPYVGARAALARGKVTATADVWFSPFASAHDRDDHLLRAKLSETDASGTAWQASLGARVALGAHDFVDLQGATVRVSTTGTQHQRFYGGEFAGLEGDIDAKITSARNSLLVSYVHRFAL
jgi:outer membrane protease